MLARKAINSVAWNSIFNIVRDIFTLTFGVYFARVIDPSVFSIFAIFTGLSGLVTSFSYRTILEYVYLNRNDYSSYIDDLRNKGAFVTIIIVASLVLLAIILAALNSEYLSLIVFIIFSILLEFISEEERIIYSIKLDWSTLRMKQFFGLLMGYVLAYILSQFHKDLVILILPSLCSNLPFFSRRSLIRVFNVKPNFNDSTIRRFYWDRWVSSASSMVLPFIEPIIMVSVVGLNITAQVNRGLGLSLLLIKKVLAQISGVVLPVFAQSEIGSRRLRLSVELSFYVQFLLLTFLGSVIFVFGDYLIDYLYGKNWLESKKFIHAGILLISFVSLKTLMVKILFTYDMIGIVRLVDITDVMLSLMSLFLLHLNGPLPYLILRGVLLIFICIYLFYVLYQKNIFGYSTVLRYLLSCSIIGLSYLVYYHVQTGSVKEGLLFILFLLILINIILNREFYYIWRLIKDYKNLGLFS